MVAVEGFVVHLARLDLLDMSTEDGFDATLAEQRCRPDLAAGLEALLLEGHAVDAEIAQRGFVGQVDQSGEVANAGLAQFVVDVEDVLKGCAFTGARAVLPWPDGR